MATVGGTYHNLVKRFKYIIVRNADWKSMCYYYDVDVIENVTEDPPRSKLQSYCLKFSSYSDNYINNLVTIYRELIKILGGFISYRYVLLILFSWITDPHFQMTVPIQ